MHNNRLHRINFRCHLLCIKPHKSRLQKFTGEPGVRLPKEIMTLETFESISVIAASWVGIICGIISLLKSRGNSNPAHTSEAEVHNSGRYSYGTLFNWVRPYILTMVFFMLVIANTVINTKVVSIIDVLSIASCVGAIIFMLVACAYKYTIWQTMRAIDDDILC